jgi:aspartyl-tRNA(Asn)/glutamyl-tRNA(Gln) amidotransferase subunit B
VEEARRSLPELPRARAERYQRDLGLSAFDAGLLTAERAVAEFFDAALAAYGAGPEAAKRVANWLTGEGARLANETGLAPAAWKLRPVGLAAILRLLDAGTVNGNGAKVVFEELFRAGGEAEAVVRARGLSQVSDEGAIEGVVERVVLSSPAEAERYRAGNKKLLGFFVGKVMKELEGKGNPGVVNALVKKKLGD